MGTKSQMIERARGYVDPNGNSKGYRVSDHRKVDPELGIYQARNGQFMVGNMTEDYWKQSRHHWTFQQFIELYGDKKDKV